MVEFRENGEENSTGEVAHSLAEQAREEGKFLNALTLTDEATIKYQREGNVPKLSEVQSSRFLTFRHLFEQTGDEAFKILARHAVEASIDIIRASGEKIGLGIPIYNLAKWQQTNGELAASVSTMKEALAAFQEAPGDPMGLPSVKAEIGARRAAIEYQLGDDSALGRFNESVERLRSNPYPSDYNQNVWIAGSYIHMAEAFNDRGNKTQGKEYLEKASEIISADNRLVLYSEKLRRLSPLFD